VFGLNKLLALRRRYLVGAGSLASVIGLYSFAAQFGLAPANPAVAVQWLTNTVAPILTQAEVRLSPASNKTPATSTGYTPASAFNSATYPTSAYSTNSYGNGAYSAPNYPAQNYPATDIATYFSPNGGCTEAIVTEIRQARQQILIQAYSFTSPIIANALVEAHNRGVSVILILDKSQQNDPSSAANYLAQAGITTLIDAAHAVAHNKIILIDGHTIITGSFNFTNSAEQSNAENLLVIRNRPDLYQAYQTNFGQHYSHSQPHQSHSQHAPTASGITAYPH